MKNGIDKMSLSLSFANSLKDELFNTASDYVELGLDSVLDDGLLKDVPLVSTVVALYKIGNSFKERHNIKKLYIFIDEINKRIVDENKLEEYKEKFKSNDNFRNQEIEYLLVLLDRYIDYNKPQMLAKLYLAYLDGVIIWEELTMYAEVVDRFLLLDCGTLTSNGDRTIVPHNIGGESVLRLVALGLMTEITDTSTFIEDGNGRYALSWGSLYSSRSLDKIYKRTEFGEKLSQILRE